MSDFLARLTTRHADGAASPIVPRAASRFESVAGPTPEVVDREIPIPPRRSEATVDASHVAEPLATREVADRAASVPLDREPIADAKITAIHPASSTTLRIEQILKHVETIVNSPPTLAEPTRESAKEPGIVAMPVVPRIVGPTARRELDTDRGAATRASSDAGEPTVIRVHIGRIEVRTTPAPAERPRVRSPKAADQPKPMSLERYLSGKDRA